MPGATASTTAGSSPGTAASSRSSARSSNGPPTDAAGAKLQRAVAKHRRNLFLFLTNRALAPTNNESERALRPCVTFRKVTGGFRTPWGATLYADVRSVLETARRRAIQPLHAIALTLKGSPLPLHSA